MCDEEKTEPDFKPSHPERPMAHGLGNVGAESPQEQCEPEQESQYVQRGGPYPNDPWRHRSSNMKCYTCMWFVAKGTRITGPPGEMLGKTLGRCRRRAPTMSGYPVVFGHDWCGDHKLDENK